MPRDLPQNSWQVFLRLAVRKQLSIIFWPSFLWRADATELQEGVSVPHWKDARSCRKFLAGVYAALCKDAAAPKILAGVPVGRCADGATAKFLTGRSYRNRFCVSL